MINSIFLLSCKQVISDPQMIINIIILNLLYFLIVHSDTAWFKRLLLIDRMKISNLTAIIPQVKVAAQ